MHWNPGTLEIMARGKLRLGGMALQNGVLVHGPTAWGCSIRLPSGELRVASGRKRFLASRVGGQPLLRGPARLLETLALLPNVRRALPGARFPFERPGVVAAIATSTLFGAGLGRIGGTTVARELLRGLAALGPAVLALRGGELSAYHGAEHVSIGTYEHGEPREKEHERCGSHLIGPLLATTSLGNVLASQAPAHLRGIARLGASVGALAATTELFGWMVRNPGSGVSRLLSKPGYELQRRLATSEPSPEQLEVAEAALTACLELEAAVVSSNQN